MHGFVRLDNHQTNNILRLSRPMSMLSDVSGLMGRGLLQLLTDVSPAAVATIFRGAVEASFCLTPLRLMNQSAIHQPGNIT
jgi:hypothetical protein